MMSLEKISYSKIFLMMSLERISYSSDPIKDISRKYFDDGEDFILQNISDDVAGEVYNLHLRDQPPVLVFLTAWASNTWRSVHQLVGQLLHELSKDTWFHVDS